MLHFRSYLFPIVLGALAPACRDSNEPGNDAPQDAAISDSDADVREVGDSHKLATAVTHTCAIRKAGLYCWGLNVLGALGDGTTDDSEAAVHARAAGEDVVEVVPQASRTCVRRRSGEVACWGNNDHGQIGDGTREDTLTAVPALGIDDARQLAADTNSTCVVHGAARGVSCWGESPRHAPDAGSLVPQTIPGLSSVEQLRSSSFSSYCALDSARAVHCWRIRDGMWTAPQTVEALSGVRAITMPHPDQVCAVTEAEGIICQSILDDVRVQLPSSTGAVDVVSGSGGLVACAPDAGGAWFCWNVPSVVFASMGVPDVAGEYAFEIVTDLPVRALSIAGVRLCVLRSDETVACVDLERVGTLDDLQRIEVSTVVPGLPD